MFDFGCHCVLVSYLRQAKARISTSKCFPLGIIQDRGVQQGLLGLFGSSLWSWAIDIPSVLVLISVQVILNPPK